MWILPKNLSTSPSAQDTEESTSDSSELSKKLEQSVMWRSKPSSSSTWLRRLKRNSWMLPLFSQTSNDSPGSNLLDEWISSQEAFLVSHLVPQDDAQEMKTPDTSGLTSQTESSDWEGLPLFCLKTSKESSRQNSKGMDGPIQKAHLFCSMSSENWKGWVTKRRQEYSQRVKSAHLTSANEYSLWVCAPILGSQDGILFQECSEIQSQESNWLTPATTGGRADEPLYKKNGEVWTGEGRAYRENGMHRTLTLKMQVEAMGMWNTPRSSAAKAPMGGSPNSKDYTYRLENQVQPINLWNTPQARDYKGVDRNKIKRGFSPSLPNQVQPTPPPEAQNSSSGNPQGSQNWATPTAGTKDHMGSSLEYYRRRSAIGKQVDLNGQVLIQNWTTPSTRDYKDACLKKEVPIRRDGRTRMDTMPQQVHHQEQYKGKLNPRWVETLMGLPVGWTMPSCVNPWTTERMNSECWETELSQVQQNEHSESSGMLWSTPPASQRGDTYLVYLRHGIKRLKKGEQPFAPTLEVSVALAELGLSTSTVDLFSGLDLTEDTEDLILKIIRKSDG